MSIPNVPTLSRTPTSSVDVPAGACCAASGSQVCTGKSGALMANARKKPRNSSRSIVTGIGFSAKYPTRFVVRNASSGRAPVVGSIGTWT
ncbi:Uncharacterised protein [Mycobacteroides abscessus]|nr:Uncharacterised protein [Mycobacteroides abscessus]